jgi:hypothetical protein
MFAAALGTSMRFARMHEHFPSHYLARAGASGVGKPHDDVLQTETEIMILIALPSVAPEGVDQNIMPGRSAARPTAPSRQHATAESDAA